jgi:hypothetical protein
MTRLPARLLTFAAAALAAVAPALAQDGLTQPPSGDNQYASATQGIGPVRLTIEYHSPDVHSPTGEDRHGKIWGGLVPYGMANLGFGDCGDQCPWRGGANENTVFTTSHDVTVQGKPLPAGSYGLHFIAGKDEWTVIFSKNHTSWGSYSYDAKEDALRVTAKPEKSEYHEWLTYEFTDRQPDKATLALKWEDLQLPIVVGVDDINAVYLDAMRRELRSSPGFDARNFTAAAAFSLQNKADLPQGLIWAQKGVAGQADFQSLSTLAQLQAANGKDDESRKTMDRAINHPTATAIGVHQYARQLQAQKKNEEAMRIFQLNAKRFPDQWPVHLGLARGHAALGHAKDALAEAQIALKAAPDDASRQSVQALIDQLGGAKGNN